MKYHHLLQNHILDRIRVGERFHLDQFFSVESDSIIRKLESRYPQVTLAAYQHVRDRPPPKRQIPPIKQPPIKLSQKKLICFKHRPHENQRCQDQACLKSKEHLDTSLPDQLARWTKAHQAFDRGKRSSNNRR
jgi:hypothetical protein